MIKEALLAHVPISVAQIHRVPTELGDPATVAATYEAEIRNFFKLSPNEWPRFDLVLLGLGADGHIASLFPGKPAVEETQRLVVATSPGSLPPHVDRVTLTLPVLNAARAVAFIVKGANKAPVLRAAREGLPLDGIGDVPAARVRPTNGVLHWFVDAAAPGSSA